MLRITPLRIFGFALLLWYGAVGLYFIFHVPFSDYAPDWHGHMT